MHAQNRGEYSFEEDLERGVEAATSPLIDVDTTLFRLSNISTKDFYGDATRYYHTPATTRRRGLYYTYCEDIIEPIKEYRQHLTEPYEQSKVALYSAMSRYRTAIKATHSGLLENGTALSSSLWAQTGRDLFVEGVFSNALSSDLTLGKRLSNEAFLRLDASLYYATRGLQFGSTQEAFDLTGNNFYNPTWGFYNGEVRNSRVRRTLSPTLEAHYQQPLSERSMLIVEASGRYNRRANSSLAWYNATTPMPDYYRKMPSYISQSDVSEILTNVWRNNDTDYTQINWDKIVATNSLDELNSAYYAVEDKVQRDLSVDLTGAVVQQVGAHTTMSFGVSIEADNSRNFKVMRDLLGADHLTDYDIFIGDSYNKTSPLQNDVRNPDRNVKEGDRFGYDYSLRSSLTEAVLQCHSQFERLDIESEAIIGSQSIYRYGYYEKERFAAESSYGRSSTVMTAPYMLRATLGYTIKESRYISLKLLSTRLSPNSSNLFLDPSAANLLNPTSSCEQIHSAAVAYSANYRVVTISAEVYGLISRNGGSVISLYDDLTATMARGVISGVGYCSYGAEIVAQLRLHHDLNITTTLAANRQYYDQNPTIELYDYSSLTQLTAATISRMSGVKIGNSPQIIASASATYFGVKRYIFTLSSSYAALRYEQPSIARRSERILTQGFMTTESSSAALSQQRLDDIFDVEISATRLLYLNNGDHITLRASINNLLSEGDRVSYARESDRILLSTTDGYFMGATMRASTIQYSAPRSIRLSISYTF